MPSKPGKPWYLTLFRCLLELYKLYLNTYSDTFRQLILDNVVAQSYYISLKFKNKFKKDVCVKQQIPRKILLLRYSFCQSIRQAL